MNGYKLTLEPDDDERAVWLITESTYGVRQKEMVWLRDGFGPRDVREAVLATGWVQQDGDELRLTSASGGLYGKMISEVLEQMFGYFRGPGVPTLELLEVQSAVAQYEARESGLEIPLYAYAWLDVMVREDLADEARSAEDIWARSRVDIAVDKPRDRRVEELLSRYSQAATTGTLGRMAPSLPTRKPDAARDAKTG